MLLAWLLKWDITDISWSLWAGAFWVGILATIVQNVDFYRLLRTAQTDPEAIKRRTGNGTTAEEDFFSSAFLFFAGVVLIGCVSLGVGAALNSIVPLLEPSQMSIPMVIFLPTILYWPFVLLVLLDAGRQYYRDYVIEGHSEEREERFMMTPYAMVFSRQVMMIVLMIISALKSPIAVYWALIFLFFFPWKAVWDWGYSLYLTRSDKSPNA